MSPSAPPYSPDCAFFLDIDGTLLEIAETPDAVHADAADCGLLERLHAAAGGAVALVSGRTLAMIDELFAPLKLPAAGQHGYERRDGTGRRRRHRFDAARLRPVAALLRDFARRSCARRRTPTRSPPRPCCPARCRCSPARWSGR